MRADIPQATEFRYDDWVADCGVCGANFLVRASNSPDNPSPSGTFCPDCRPKTKAPGVLHWRRRMVKEAK